VGRGPLFRKKGRKTMKGPVEILTTETIRGKTKKEEGRGKEEEVRDSLKGKKAELKGLRLTR